MDVSSFLNTEGIHHFSAQNTETKANYAERLIKTIKHRLYRYCIKYRTKRYVNVLPEITDSYNRTKHSNLGRTPASINSDNEHESRYEQYLIRQKQTRIKMKYKRKKKRPFALKRGQVVRITHVRNVFDQEYSQKWSGELFKIKRRFRREGLPVYGLEDWMGEDIEVTFYEPELQAVNVNDNTEYFVEKVLKKRKRIKKPEVLVISPDKARKGVIYPPKTGIYALVGVSKRTFTR